MKPIWLCGFIGESNLNTKHKNTNTMKHTLTLTLSTLKTIIEQARKLGATDKGKNGLKTIQCEVERPNGKRVFVALPFRLLDWLKDYKTPPAMGIAAGKQSFEAVTFSRNGKAFTQTEVCAGYIVTANATEGKRTSRLSCVIKRAKQGFAVSVFLRIDAQGVISCVERVAKLSKIECAHEKKFKRASVLSESHGGKWLLVKSAGAIWSLVLQPSGMAGVSVVVSNLGGRGMREADAMEEAGRRLTDEIKDRIFKDQWDKACELAEKAEREAREELGEEVADIVRATKPPAVEVVPVEVVPAVNDNTRDEGITQPLPVAPAIIESVTVCRDTRNEGIIEEKQWEKACAAKVALESAKLKDEPASEIQRKQRANDMAWNQLAAIQAECAPVCAAIAPVFAPCPSQDTVAVKLQSKNEAQGMVCAYSTIRQLPPATVTPDPLPFTPAKPSQKAWRYRMAWNGVKHCNHLRNASKGKQSTQGNLRSATKHNRLQNARQTGPPSTCFGLLIAASPSVGIAYYLYPLRGNYGLKTHKYDYENDTNNDFNRP